MITLTFYKGLRGSAKGYEYKRDADSANTLKEVTTSELRLVGKINHEIFYIAQWLPPNNKADIK